MIVNLAHHGAAAAAPYSPAFEWKEFDPDLGSGSFLARREAFNRTDSIPFPFPDKLGYLSSRQR
jgi:hypothetical protein